MEEIHIPDVRKCLIDRDSSAITLVRLIVEPHARRRGVGASAVQRVQAIARSLRKPLPVRLTLEPEKPEMRGDLVRFYRRLGFAMMNDNETMIWYPRK